MLYYLRHYFDPDFDHLSLKPRALPGEKADLRNLGYVRNVRPGQLLAEIIPLEECEDGAFPDERFILDEPVFPMGRHTALDPDNPYRLLATASGYVFYENKAIAVKTLLNIRGDVTFQIGNIDFVGNVHVHQNVGSGFSVRGQDVLIDGGVNNAVVRAHGDLAVLGGVRGDLNNRCILVAGRNMRLFFADKAEMRTGKNLEIEYALHGIFLVGGNLLVKKNLHGGICRVQGSMIVRSDLGNNAGTPTEVFLGPDPFLSRALHRGQQKREKLRQVVEQCTPLAAHLKEDANDCSRRLYKSRRELAALDHSRAVLTERLKRALANKKPSALYVLGTVYPGTVIDINGFSLRVKDPIVRSEFRLEGDHIVATPFEGSL